MTQGRTLRSELGRRLAQRRGTLTQEHVAEMARQHGLAWDRSTVAKVEAGDRAVTLEELLVLSHMFQMPPVRWVDVQLPDESGEDVIELGRSVSVTRKALVSMLVGHPAAPEPVNVWSAPKPLKDGWGDPRCWESEAAHHQQELRQDLEGAVADARALWPRITRQDALRAMVAARGEAEAYAAKKLCRPAFEVSVLALRLWGRTLTEERDHRVSQMSESDRDERSERAIRGAVTRALLADLGEHRPGATATKKSAVE